MNWELSVIRILQVFNLPNHKKRSLILGKVDLVRFRENKMFPLSFIRFHYVFSILSNYHLSHLGNHY